MKMRFLSLEGQKFTKLTLPVANKIYLTRVHCIFDGDAYFVELTDREWVIDKRTDYPADEKNHISLLIYRICTKKIILNRLAFFVTLCLIQTPN